MLRASPMTVSGGNLPEPPWFGTQWYRSNHLQTLEYGGGDIGGSVGIYVLDLFTLGMGISGALIGKL